MTGGPVLLIDCGSLVCSGAPKFLNATEHTFTLNSFWQIPQVPGKAGSATYNQRLPQARTTGFESPTHNINGLYDDTGRSYNNSTSLATYGYYYITGSMLRGIMLAGSTFALIDDMMVQGTGMGGGSMVYVVPTSFKSVRTPTTAISTGSTGVVIDYNLSFNEVQV